MKSVSLKSVAVRSAVAIAAVVACAGASAVTAVTFDPTKIAGVSTPMFSLDSLGVLDYADTTVGPTGIFTETGFLSVTDTVLAGTQSNLNGYNLYVSFTATGNALVPTGPLLSLNYTLYGYTGPVATFVAGPGTVSKSATVDTVLGTGGLNAGPGNIYIAGLPYFASVVANSLSFSNAAGAFSPVSSIATSFINTGSSLTPAGTGFYVNGAGGGTINLVAAPVPEPETYALMLAGLAAVGFLARRRNNG